LLPTVHDGADHVDGEVRERVEQAIVERLDLAAWKRAEVVEHAERDSLTSILNAWPGISGQASEYRERQP
jgi:hypothetical protein